MTNISVRVDNTDKILFEEFCNNVGMNISTAINMFIKNVVSRNALPFNVESDPFYSKENQAKLRKAVADLKKGKNWHYHELIEV